MAKVIETIFIVKISQLVKDKADTAETTGFEDLPGTIEQVVQELVSSDAIVEVEKA